MQFTNGSHPGGLRKQPFWTPQVDVSNCAEVWMRNHNSWTNRKSISQRITYIVRDNLETNKNYAPYKYIYHSNNSGLSYDRSWTSRNSAFGSVALKRMTWVPCSASSFPSPLSPTPSSMQFEGLNNFDTPNWKRPVCRTVKTVESKEI